MAIICIEGPSAVGKSTAARQLEALGRVEVVPEVNELFTLPATASASWYLERQTERWRRARTAQGRRAFVILDGDPFQPLWYSWAYPDEGWPPLEMLVAFYRPLLVAGEIEFPDSYVLMQLDVAELRHRRENDSTRTRRNFDKHLQLILPQARYFAALEEFCPGYVTTVQARSVGAVVAILEEAGTRSRALPSLLLFDAIVGWLQGRSPREEG
jgi:hypothetical protein